MPSLLRNHLFAAALLAATLTAAPTSAETTGADKAGVRTFAACLDKTGGDEKACIKKLGRYAWYPRDDAACEAAAERVQGALAARVAAGGQATAEYPILGENTDMRDLFFNERCARLGMPHNREAAKDPKSPALGLEFDACLEETHNLFSCDKRLGRHQDYPMDNRMCRTQGKMIKEVLGAGWKPLWSSWFENERCRRLAMPFVEP